MKEHKVSYEGISIPKYLSACIKEFVIPSAGSVRVQSKSKNK